MPNEPRLNLRLSEQENQRIKDFCAEKGIKSKSKVGKEALNFALNGKSDIDFGIKSDFSKEERKIILLKMIKKLGVIVLIVQEKQVLILNITRNSKKKF